MSTGANEINTINRTAMAGAAMVARVVIGTGVFFVNCTGNVAAKFFAAVEGSDNIGGKEKLAKLLKSGEPLEVYSFTEEKFKLFAKQAERYGIVYSVVKRDEEDELNGTYDVMVKRSDAGKLSRVLEKIGYSTTEPEATVEPVASEENVNNEPDGFTMTPKESRDLMGLMLEPDDRTMGNDQNPDLTAEREPLSADISPEKRNSVAERIENIKSVINNGSYENNESSNNLINNMLSGYDEVNDKESSINTIQDESEILMGNVSDGKEVSL